MRYVYPIVLKPKSNGGFLATVPDVPGCVTSGETLEDTVLMIRDALSGCLSVLEDEKENINKPTSPTELHLEEGTFVALVDVDTTKYRQENDNRSIRRNVSLPAWLNAKAEQNRINCSQVLQEALREKLGV